jgi:hypothetical protein
VGGGGILKNNSALKNYHNAQRFKEEITVKPLFNELLGD